MKPTRAELLRRAAKLPPLSVLAAGARKELQRRGRPTGPTMPCGWGCSAQLTATQMRQHFTDCPKRPR